MDPGEDAVSKGLIDKLPVIAEVSPLPTPIHAHTPPLHSPTPPLPHTPLPHTPLPHTPLPTHPSPHTPPQQCIILTTLLHPLATHPLSNKHPLIAPQQCIILTTLLHPFATPSQISTHLLHHINASHLYCTLSTQSRYTILLHTPFDAHPLTHKHSPTTPSHYTLILTLSPPSHPALYPY